MEKLIHIGVNLKQVNTFEMTALHYAVQYNYEHLVRSLIQHNINFNVILPYNKIELALTLEHN